MPTEAHVFLQFKNTDICIDIYCTCGEQCHYDGYFARFVKCAYCGQMWIIPHLIPITVMTSDHPDYAHAREYHAVGQRDDD